MTKIAEPNAVTKEYYVARYGAEAYNRLPGAAKLLWNKLVYIKREFDNDHNRD